jgi:hypothetical protein
MDTTAVPCAARAQTPAPASTRAATSRHVRSPPRSPSRPPRSAAAPTFVPLRQLARPPARPPAAPRTKGPEAPRRRFPFSPPFCSNPAFPHSLGVSLWSCWPSNTETLNSQLILHTSAGTRQRLALRPHRPPGGARPSALEPARASRHRWHRGARAVARARPVAPCPSSLLSGWRPRSRPGCWFRGDLTTATHSTRPASYSFGNAIDASWLPVAAALAPAGNAGAGLPVPLAPRLLANGSLALAIGGTRAGAFALVVLLCGAPIARSPLAVAVVPSAAVPARSGVAWAHLGKCASAPPRACGPAVERLRAAVVPPPLPTVAPTHVPTVH